MERERILIAGAGYLGVALGLRLLKAGHQVLALRRDPAGLPPGFVGISGDLSRPERIAPLPPVDRVVFAAGPDGSTESHYQHTFIDGIRGLQAQMKVQLNATTQGCGPLQRWIFTSSTAVYGQEQGELVDETSPTVPRQRTGQLLLEAEQLTSEFGVTSISVRFGGIYGPGRHRLLDAVRRGDPLPPLPDLEGKSPDRTAIVPWANRIHRDDAARVLEHLLFLPNPAPVYVATDHEPAPSATVSHWIAQALGRPPEPLADQPIPGPPIRRRNDSSKRCQNARLVASGFAFTYPTFREGYGALLSETSPGACLP